MSTLQWPAGWFPKQFDLGVRRNVVQFRSPMTNDLQSVDLLVWRWRATLVMRDEHSAGPAAGAQEAFFNELVGGANDVELYHFARPVPTGSLRGTPALQSPMLKLANSFVLTGCAPGSTLYAGDMIGLASQLLQVRANAIANAGGQMTVLTVNRSRALVDAGTLAVWDRPKARFAISEQAGSFPHSAGIMAGSSWELDEVVV